MHLSPRESTWNNIFNEKKLFLREIKHRKSKTFWTGSILIHNGERQSVADKKWEVRERKKEDRKKKKLRVRNRKKGKGERYWKSARKQWN